MGAEILLLILLMSVAGALLGAFTGLVPGIHVNTLAAVMLTSYPALYVAVSGFADPAVVPVLVSACIMSASVVHSFMDFIPAVFIGAPDADEALTMLPGHRMLMNGEGMAAVRAAAIGSAVGALSAIALAVPIQFIMLNGAAEIMNQITLYVVLFVSIVIIFSAEGTEGKILATILFVVSGALGLVCDMNVLSQGLFGNGTLLFPLLSGLFGIPPLLRSVGNEGMPEQYDYEEDPVGPLPGLKGVLTGCVAGWFPGITATAGAALSASVSKEERPENFISLVASIGTVTSVFSLVTLSVTGSGRSGTSVVIKEIIGDGLEGFCSEAFLLLLMTICIAAAFGYIMTIAAGRGMSTIADRIDPYKMSVGALILLILIVALMTGIGGLCVLTIATLLGLVPQYAGTSRIPLTGCLLLPVILSGLI
ncbi:MAG TPA: tripartite tricarboxylate transporter permease [Candidatus Methanomethylophilaceae archaeon]|nr:tripartite tricarboxylate transporter permease [Candidatus Methanomethylophilaceae archaeon]